MRGGGDEQRTGRRQLCQRAAAREAFANACGMPVTRGCLSVCERRSETPHLEQTRPIQDSPKPKDRLGSNPKRIRTLTLRTVRTSGGVVSLCGPYICSAKSAAEKSAAGWNELEELLVVSKQTVSLLEEPRRGLSHYGRFSKVHASKSARPRISSASAASPSSSWAPSFGPTSCRRCSASSLRWSPNALAV